MPSWSVHLAIAKKVNMQLNLKKDLFYFGNLIPDVDNNCKHGRYAAHYYNENLPFLDCLKEKMIDIDHFLKDYKVSITNPLILGYYAHLLVDNYYNNIVYSKCWIKDKDNNIVGIKLKNNRIKNIDADDRKHQKKKYKHHDFDLYGKYLFNDKAIDIPKATRKIIENLKYLKGKLLNEQDVINKVYYLNHDFERFNKLTIKEKIFKNNYKLFTKQELDIIYQNCCDYVLNTIKEVSLKNIHINCNIKTKWGIQKMEIYKGRYFEVVFEDWCQDFIGSCIISSHNESLSEMTSEEWVELGIIEKELERVCKKLFNTTMFNFACLMNNAYRDNKIPHVHFWFVPRYKDEIIIFNKKYKDKKTFLLMMKKLKFLN